MFSLVSIGVISAYADKEWFEDVYTVEDGLIEWLTVLPLAVVSIACLVRIIYRRGSLSGKMIASTVFIALFSLFALGEEISWGQRIFNIQSSSFFKTYNAQQEMNLHNMVVDGVKVNKLIFSQLLTVAIAFYLLVFPWLYRKKQWVRSLANSWAVPVPRVYQIISFLLLFVLIGLCPSGKNAELLELGATTLFCLIILYPFNPIGSVSPEPEQVSAE
ncbi:hypothetical protein ACFQHR_04670 [Rufibacter roseus]|uniref:Uncharacterized protein n=2 Tax=Rufibacter roseus TaxID=1567108 RepID=A0ABW2DGG8_9BACT